MSVSFRTMLVGGPTATAAGIEVPEALVLGFGAGKRVPVTVTINGRHTYRSTVGPYKGAYMISVSSANKAAAGVTGGDEVEVSLEHDTAPRIVELPAELEAALVRAGKLEAFRALSNSAQTAHALSVSGAKTDETRERRILKVVDSLD